MPCCEFFEGAFVISCVKVGEQENYASSPSGYATEKFKGYSQVSAMSFRLSEKQFADEPVGVPYPLSWRDELLNSVGKQKQANSVVAANCCQDKRSSDLSSQFAFQFPLCSKKQRWAYVNDDENSQFPFVPKLFDIGFAHPRRHIPINHPDIVARLILPHFLKLKPLSFEDAFVSAEKHFADEPSQFHFKPFDPAQDFRWRCRLR